MITSLHAIIRICEGKPPYLVSYLCATIQKYHRHFVENRQLMHTSTIAHTRLHPSLLLALFVLLLCTACSSGGTATTTKPLATPMATTPTPTQPVSARQILAAPLTYVALGASDAVGVGSNQPGSQGYVPLLAERLPKGSHSVNLGISGIHLHEALSQELPLALTTSPKLISIWLVANDFVAGVPFDSYMQDLDTLLKQLRAGTQARIVMANLPDLTRLPAFSNQSADQKARMLAAIERWNTRIASIAMHYHVALVDLFSQYKQLTQHPEYISIDGFHPSPLGYVQLANDFWQAIMDTP